MKKMRGLLVVFKNILMAIIMGGLLGNLVCILEFLPTITPFAGDYIPRLLLITVVSYLLFYFLFMRHGRMVYGLVFIPSELILGLISVDLWWSIFESSADAKSVFGRAGVAMLLMPSLFMCTLMILVMGLFRFRKWLKEGEKEMAEMELARKERIMKRKQK